MSMSAIYASPMCVYMLATPVPTAGPREDRPKVVARGLARRMARCPCRSDANRSPVPRHSLKTRNCRARHPSVVITATRRARSKTVRGGWRLRDIHRQRERLEAGRRIVRAVQVV